MKVVYYECDRCNKKINSFKDVATFGLIKKSFELCSDCTNKLKKWFKEGASVTNKEKKQNG